ncbi:MAG: hypothetical protein V3U54_08035 [Thermodesulfobacteriota bacterium]
MGVGIEIDLDSPEAKKDGLNSQRLRQAVVKALKDANVKVISKLNIDKAPGKPKLVVLINPVKHSGGMYSFTFIVSLDQEVNLSRDLNLKGTASTWSVVATGAALPEDLDKMVGQFFQAFDSGK